MEPKRRRKVDVWNLVESFFDAYPEKQALPKTPIFNSLSKRKVRKLTDHEKTWLSGKPVGA